MQWKWFALFPRDWMNTKPNIISILMMDALYVSQLGSLSKREVPWRGKYLAKGRQIRMWPYWRITAECSPVIRLLKSWSLMSGNHAFTVRGFWSWYLWCVHKGFRDNPGLAALKCVWQKSLWGLALCTFCRIFVDILHRPTIRENTDKISLLARMR